MSAVIIGSGASVPERVVTNHDLAQIMDTTDEWIVKRSGVRQRHFAPVGVGSSDLAAAAVGAAIADAGLLPADIDAVVCATMTPDQFAPGIAPQVQQKAGLGAIAAYDLRQQCSGFLYGLDLAASLIESGRNEHVVVVGAEVHRGYLPFAEGWDILAGDTSVELSEQTRTAIDESRGWAVLFGDGAAAVVVSRHDDPDVGFGPRRLHTDGTWVHLIEVKGVGFRNQPWVDEAQLQARLHWPSMSGAELFRQASVLMPEAVAEVAAEAKLTVGDLDLVIAHQANARIVEAARKRLGVAESVVPMNIDRWGNTTAATLPLLWNDLAREGKIPEGATIAFTAFGSGVHWGALLYRHP